MTKITESQRVEKLNNLSPALNSGGKKCYRPILFYKYFNTERKNMITMRMPSTDTAHISWEKIFQKWIGNNM